MISYLKQNHINDVEDMDEAILIYPEELVQYAIKQLKLIEKFKL